MDRVDKVLYVKSQPQSRPHKCHWPGCDRQVPPAVWGCLVHWRKLPQRLRDAVWRTYRPGQEIAANPSVEYVKVANRIQKWIKEQALGKQEDD